jgi:hypothetical protein
MFMSICVNQCELMPDVTQGQAQRGDSLQKMTTKMWSDWGWVQRVWEQKRLY